MNHEQAIEEYAEAKVNHHIKRVISMLNCDLYNGPLYLTADGETCSMFDEDYHHAFDFRKACSVVSEHLSAVLPGALYIEDWCGMVEEHEPEGYEDEETGEYIEPGPYYVFDYRAVVEAVVGRELAHHVA